MLLEYDRIYKILEILHTIEEGIVYAKEQLMNLYIDESIGMIYETMEAIYRVEDYFMQHDASHLMDEHRMDLEKAMDWVVKAYEKQETIDKVLKRYIEYLKVFKKWKESIEKNIRPYVIN